MRRFLPILTLLLLSSGPARAQGLLIPTENNVAPLVMNDHQVQIDLEDQVAVTRVTQTFYNPSSRPLEATYVFPVPQGASVQRFSMWVDGKEVKGELVEADKARAIYTDIVRRTQDPGLLEYLGGNLLRVRVFPVPANGEQKLALSYTSVAPSDAGMVEYLYPLKAAGPFTLDATLKAQHPLQNIYSPTHAVQVNRINDREARVHVTSARTTPGKDFRLYYTAAAGDVGLTALLHRPLANEDGHFMLLISPRAELARSQHIARDMVFVLDTSGSMAGKRIQQARSALKFCLRNLDSRDRFGLLHFATTVTNHTPSLTPATAENLDRAAQWVDSLEAVGSTNIEEALATALAMRPDDSRRNFTIVFFTDGQPTIGETDPQKLLQGVVAKNTADTRIFTFGVGDDVNAVLLDQLAEKTRSVATYVREHEDIEAKVSSLYAKISHPVLTNLHLSVGSGVTISEIYPPQLPDLFHGSQLVVLGRYQGHGQAAVKLTGMVGTQAKEFTYDVDFASHTDRHRAFVEDLWARRKVGYLLDQIRIHGENTELKDEVVSLAKRHGIATPYTSYLVVPDGPAGVAGTPSLGNSVSGPNTYSLHGAQTSAPSALPSSSAAQYAAAPPYGGYPGPTKFSRQRRAAQEESEEEEEEEDWQATGNALQATHSGKAGVDLSLQLNQLRNQDRMARATLRTAAGRTCLNLSGVWTDQEFDAKLPVVKIKAQGDAYFSILQRHPEMAEVFRLGNRVVWVTPNRSVLVIDPTDGLQQMSDDEVDRLFVAAK
jgi:Ca-activated chloride channel family protein